MKTIYCISGLGADEKLFSKIILPGYEVIHLQWITPQNNETINAYAKRMSESIKHDQPVLIGLSFGGMICLEISRHIPIDKIILISSIKASEELPRWMKLAGKFRLNKLVPLRSNFLTEPFQNRNLGIETKEEKVLARQYRRNINRIYLKWAINAILNWKSDRYDVPIYHIHGGHDRIFPLRNIKADYIIPSSGHMMIMNRAEKITKIILEILEKF